MRYFAYSFAFHDTSGKLCLSPSSHPSLYTNNHDPIAEIVIVVDVDQPSRDLKKKGV